MKCLIKLEVEIMQKPYATAVEFVCGSVCIKFGDNWTIFKKVTIKSRWTRLTMEQLQGKLIYDHTHTHTYTYHTVRICHTLSLSGRVFVLCLSHISIITLPYLSLSILFFLASFKIALSCFCFNPSDLFPVHRKTLSMLRPLVYVIQQYGLWYN